jgi:3'-phosphoadenosine 5'-phosphosulfate sulfotransferase (PAPS reductase)/FAD synthetase
MLCPHPAISLAWSIQTTDQQGISRAAPDPGFDVNLAAISFDISPDNPFIPGLSPGGPMIPRLASYHWIVVNSSNGKDSQTMLDHVVEQCDQVRFSRSRILVAHADLGRIEWPGARKLAETQARHYGLEFIAVKRPQGDLLDHISQRRMFPSPTIRFCTADHKRGQVMRIFTRLADRSRQEGVKVCRILNCLGLRAEESPARSKRQPFAPNMLASNGRRWVDDRLPIHSWKVSQVWARIKGSDVPYHRAYRLGMPRLSCCFCFFSPRSALLLAGQHNPELLAEYVRVERAISHRFRVDLSLAEIQQALVRGEQPGRIHDWAM